MKVKLFTCNIVQRPAETLSAIIITAMGLVTTFLILTLYITDRETDRDIPEHQRLYRIESQFNLPGGDIVRSAQIPFPLVDALQKNSDIESVSYACRLNTPLHHQGKITPQVTIFAVTPAFMAQFNHFGNQFG